MALTLGAFLDWDWGKNFKMENSPFINNLAFDTPTKASWLLKGQGVRVEIILALATLVTLVIYKKLVASKVDSGKKKLPRVQYGPFKLPGIIEGICTLITLKRVGLNAYNTWTKKYGLVFELPFFNDSVICVEDPNIVQQILQSSEPAHLNKPRFIYDKIFVESLRDGMVASDYSGWSPHKKMLSRAFTYRALRTYLNFMNEHAKSLSQNLLKECDQSDLKAEGNGEFDVDGNVMFELIYFHSLKIILQILMGEDTSCSDEDSIFFHKRFRRAKDIVMYRFNHAELMLDPIWALHPMKREFDGIFLELADFAHKRTDKLKEKRDWERQQGISQRRNLDEEVEGDDEAYSRKEEDDVGQKPFRCMIEEMLHCDASNDEIFSEVSTFISAGHETMTISIYYFMWHLACNPHHQDLCREEVDAILDAKACHESEASLNMEDLYNLKHMERCIHESLRMTPSIPMFARRLDTPLKINEDFEIAGGSNIMFTANVIHMNPKYFPSPEKFDPDRFLPENVKSRTPCTYFPFAMGPRNCLGQKLSIVQLKVIAGWILRHFELYTTDKFEDINWMFEVTIMPHRMLNLNLKRRSVSIQ